jgi:FtsP/CotA-like multicopper oxidase with cupredoxin domain
MLSKSVMCVLALGTSSLSTIAWTTRVREVARAPSAPADQFAVANDNRTPAGSLVGDTLVLRLTVSPVMWGILGDSSPGFQVAAFAEEGKTPTIPGPLVRVRVGTPIHVVIHNPLGDTLMFRGLSERGATHDSLAIAPGGVADVRFVARAVGTYQYWGALASAQRAIPLPPAARLDGLVRPRFDSQLAGAFIVDPPGPVAPDRILVITETDDERPPHPDRHGLIGRQFTAINGRSWPNTERLHYALGDTIRWRVINTTFQAHPMHLHGFFFRVDSHGSAITDRDSIYAPAEQRMAVTEVIGTGESISLMWVPDRPGGWIFHCHLTNHAAMMPAVDHPEATDYPIMIDDHGDPDHHFVNGMNGLIVGITVTGKTAARAPWHPAKTLHLFIQSDSAAGDVAPRFGYVLQRGAEPRRDSVQNPGPVLFLTRGEPTSVIVTNRTAEPTAVHWHGMEIGSYYDGAVGWSGTAGHTAPAIRPDSSFNVHITPKRAGTFLYHTHFDELRQQYGGLVGALIVLEPRATFDSTRDLIFLLSDTDRGELLVNGSVKPPLGELHVGTTYRFRVADIAVARPALRARVVRDSSMMSWRPVAKDGFTLPAAQATVRPSDARVASGETADFEFTPDRAGDVALQFGTPNRRGALDVEGLVHLMVVP